MRRALPIVGLALAAVAFLYALVSLQLLTSATGETYPPYSSLRADPLGTKVLYDSLAESGIYHVERWYKPLEGLVKTRATIVRPSFSVAQWRNTRLAETEPWERLARSGARIVVGIHGLRSSRDKNRELLPVETRLGVHLEEPSRRVTPNAVLMETGLILELNDASWTCLLSTEDGCQAAERPFGLGAIVLVTKPYLLSNEGLARERDTVLITKILGENSRNIIFDEAGLGIEESGSLMGLLRRFRLVPALIVLLVLGGLFIWRGSASLAPPRGSMPPTLQGRSAVAGLTNLLRRSIPEPDLVAACLDEWNKTRTLAGRHSPERLEKLAQTVAEGGGAVETYRAAAQVLREKS